MPGNAQKIIAAARTAYAQGSRLLLTPELSICGFGAEDLFLRPAFIAARHPQMESPPPALLSLVTSVCLTRLCLNWNNPIDADTAAAQTHQMGRLSQARFRWDARRCEGVFGHAIDLAQAGGKHADVKPLSGFGSAGVLEVVEDHQEDTFRAVYTVRLAGWVYVLHCFQKKSKAGIKTPQADVELFKARLKAAEIDFEAWKKASQGAKR